MRTIRTEPELSPREHASPQRVDSGPGGVLGQDIQSISFGRGQHGGHNRRALRPEQATEGHTNETTGVRRNNGFRKVAAAAPGRPEYPTALLIRRAGLSKGEDANPAMASPIFEEFMSDALEAGGMTRLV